MNKYGLSEKEQREIISLFEKLPAIDEVILFGSRAMNTFTSVSDIDFAIKGENISAIIGSLKSDFDDSAIIYEVDVIDYKNISSEALLEHIKKHGKLFYRKGWIETTLGEVYIFSSGLSKKRDQFGYGYSFLTFKDVFNNWFLPNELNSLANTTQQERKKCSIKRGDVFVTRTSETQEELGMSSVALKNYTDATFNGFTKRLRPKEIANIFPEFIGYYFRARYFRKTIRTMASMTTRASLNNNTLSILPIILPPLPEQKAIAKLLSSFDEKIELLREQNETSETIVQTIFKEWFVKFNYPGATGEMVDSELGEIPKGWRVEQLGKELEVKRGGSPRPIKDYISDSGYRWLKNSDATASTTPFIFKIKEHIKKKGLNKTTLLKRGSLVLSNSATPGVPKFLEVDSCIHDGWLHFPKTSVFSYQYLYLFFKHIRKSLIQQGNGSVFENLKTDILKSWDMVVPDTKTMKSFDELVSIIFEKIKNNTTQIQTLTKTRDTLLPKLMSGEVRTTQTFDI